MNENEVFDVMEEVTETTTSNGKNGLIKTAVTFAVGLACGVAAPHIKKAAKKIGENRKAKKAEKEAAKVNETEKNEESTEE